MIYTEQFWWALGAIFSFLVFAKFLFSVPSKAAPVFLALGFVGIGSVLFAVIFSRSAFFDVLLLKSGADLMLCASYGLSVGVIVAALLRILIGRVRNENE